ncbi:MAG: hypothetical protein HY075_02325 [Deltaproteobacteria bacterium]|nr:hypothetical protein [Deltaproteobacteria bacterium]
MPGKLRIVVLECPYDTRKTDPRTWSLLTKNFDLKLDGYQREYSDPLPVDGTDLVACHQIVVREEGASLVPLMAYRSITAERCRRFHMPFPLLAQFRELGLVEHAEAVSEVLARAAKSNLDVCWDSSYTISPLARADEALANELRDVMRAMHVLYHQAMGDHEVLAGGVLKFKMDRLYQFWGYEVLKLAGRELGPIRLPSLGNELGLAFHLSGAFSELARAHAEKFRALWDSRIQIGTDDRRIAKPAA